MSEATQETWLEQDKEVPGQKYVCLSFLSPEKVLANKEVFFFTNFVKDYEIQYKISATEKFLMEQVTSLTAALSKVEDILADVGAPSADLSGSDLSGSDLSGSDLSGSDLSGSDLSGSDLSGSDLSGSDLSGSDLSGSDLSGSDLSSSDLSGSDATPAPLWNEKVATEIRNVRAKISRDVAADLEHHVRRNMKEFTTTTIQEAYEDYMFKNRKKLEDEFFAKNEFRTTVRGLKIRGSYDTQPEAAARAKALQKQDPYFNVFVGQVGFWLPWDPEPSDVQDQEYAEENLNNLMKNYKQNETLKEELYEQTKRERMSGARVVKPSFNADSGAGSDGGMFGSDGAADLAISRKMNGGAVVNM